MGIRGMNESSSTTAAVAGLSTSLTAETTARAAISTLLGTSPQGRSRDVARRLELNDATGRAIPIGDINAWVKNSGGTGTGSSATLGTDTDGSTYLRLQTTNGWYRIGRDMPINLSGGRMISFLMRRVDANLTTLDFYFSYGAYDITTSATQWNKGVSLIDTGQWTRVVIHPKQYEAMIGTVTDFTDLRQVTLRITAAASQTTQVDFKDFRVHEAGPGSVSIQFDDGRDDTYTTAFPLMAAKGFRGAVAVEYDTVGNAGRCTLAQLQEMYAAGWDMLGHYSAQIGSLTESQQETVHRASKAWLQSNGFLRGSHIWVWPGGDRSVTAEGYAARYWRTMRRTASFAVRGARHVYDPLNPSIVYVVQGTTLATMRGYVDDVLASGGHVHFVFHSLVTSKVAAEDWFTSDFSSLLDYIEQQGVQVVPTSEAWTNGVLT